MMNEISNRPERTLVFEDNNINEPEFSEAAASINSYVDTTYPSWSGAFGWHDEWRAEGESAIVTSKAIKRTAQKRFEEAYTFCATGSFSGICFFDFELRGVNVEVMQQWEGIKRDLPEGLVSYIVEYPGLLLAIAAEKNQQAIVDVWLATSSKVSLNKLRKPLSGVSTRFMESSKGSLSLLSLEDLTDVLEAAVDEYVATHSPDDIDNIFWPDHATNWFNASTSDQSELTAEVPHNRPSNDGHVAFTRLTEYAKAIASYGKMIDGDKKAELLDSEIADLKNWVTSEGGYEALKSFVGHCSPCFEGHHPNTHQLKLSAFTIPLLAAVGPGNWFKNVPWEELKSFETRILVKDKACCREAILSAFKFFRTLQTNSKNKELNDFAVRFLPARSSGNKKDCLAYLDVSVSFFDLQFLSRLCGGSVEPEDNIEAGDSTLAFRNLKESLRNTGLGPFTHLWVFPEAVENVQRTVIRFGVYDSDKYAN
jgi:hypothetical protein